MPNVISGLDAAWTFPNRAGLKAFKAQGGKVIAGYLSYDPSKDWTAARLTMVHGLGLGALMNFEHTANRALSGRGAGIADGERAWDEISGLIKAVGYAPKNHLHVYASADFDAQPSQYPAIDAYLTGFGQGLLNRHANADQGVYGSYTLVVHTAAAGTSKGEWQTYAWSGGKFYTGAEYYQWSNSHNAFGGAVDYDQAINLEHLGAWWPPGSTYDRPATPSPTTASTTDPWEQIMAFYKDKADFEKALRGIVHDELSKQTRNELLPADAPADDKTKGPHRVETYLNGIPGYVEYSKR